MIEFLIAGWPIFLIASILFVAIGIFVQLRNIKKLGSLDDSSDPMGDAVKRFAVAVSFIILAGISSIGLIASIILNAIQYFGQ